jgi:hypothetical protein
MEHKRTRIIDYASTQTEGGLGPRWRDVCWGVISGVGAVVLTASAAVGLVAAFWGFGINWMTLATALMALLLRCCVGGEAWTRLRGGNR